LNSNLRDIPERHRSIQALFEESWKLLKPEEPSALMRLALFQGQIPLDLALEIGVQLPQLASLAEKSLIQHNQENRYHLHALVRRFVLDKLESTGELAAYTERHSLYFAERLANARQASPESPLVIQQLGESYDDYLFALRWAVQQQRLDVLADFIVGLAPYWEANFLIVEAMNWIRLALAMIKDESSQEAQAKIFVYAGVFSRYEPSLPQAQIYLKKGIELAQAVKDSRRLFRGMNMLGHIYALQGEFSNALRIYEDMLEVSYRAEDDYWIARTHNSLGGAALDMDELYAGETASRKSFSSLSPD
jgi:tetratricopeptide (TPR) repeat protein